MKARLLLLLVLGVALAAMPAVAFGDSARHLKNTTTYPDSTGEDPAAPDITSVVVSNDDAGLITFQVTVSNRPTLTQDMEFLILLDIDKNASTGAAAFLGADYVIDLVSGSVDLFHWNGSDYVRASSQASLVYSYAATGPLIRVSAADLGKPKSFNFGVEAISGEAVDAQGNFDGTNVHRDFAPDQGHGLNGYNVLTKLVLSVTAFTVAPKPARAGRALSASMAANQNDTAGPVQSGTVTCSATVGGKSLVATTHAVRNGVAVCIWRLPATAKGLIVRGFVTLHVRTASTTRGFSARVT